MKALILSLSLLAPVSALAETTPITFSSSLSSFAESTMWDRQTEVPAREMLTKIEVMFGSGDLSPTSAKTKAWMIDIVRLAYDTPVSAKGYEQAVSDFSNATMIGCLDGFDDRMNQGTP